MLVFAYIGYAMLVLILAGAVGTFFSALNRRANPVFASPGWLGAISLFFGVPCYKVASYIRTQGDKGLALLILILCSCLGVFVGLHSRAGRP